MKKDISEFIKHLEDLDPNDIVAIEADDLEDFFCILEKIVGDDEPKEEAKKEAEPTEEDLRIKQRAAELKDAYGADIQKWTLQAAAAAANIETLTDTMSPLTYELVDSYNDAVRKLFPLRFSKHYLDEVYGALEKAGNERLKFLMGEEDDG